MQTKKNIPTFEQANLMQMEDRDGWMHNSRKKTIETPETRKVGNKNQANYFLNSVISTSLMSFF